MGDYLKVNEQLRDMFPDLPRALRVVATYLMEHPGDIATLSMRQVASNAGVSLPNFSRLAKLLGYETYGELREIYRRQVQQHDVSYYQLRAENLQKSNKDNDNTRFWGDLQNAVTDNVTALFETMDADYLADVARVVAESEHVYLIGMQASHSFAQYLNYLGGMTSDKFRLVRSEGGIYADTITDVSERDAVIAVSQQPCAGATVRLAKVAQDRKAKIIAISDSPASPLAMCADHVLLTPNQSPLFFESYVSATIMIEALIGFYTLNNTPEVIGRIEKIEADRILLGEYWKDED